MPELPEVEATARLLDAAVRGATVDSARAPGLATMRTFDPSLDALAGAVCTGVGRRGKLLLVALRGGGLDAPATLVCHLMSAGRLQLFATRAGPRDRTARLLVRLNGGADGHDGERELRLREFGTRQAAWVALRRDETLDADDTLRALGPDAWPGPPDLDRLPPRRTLRGALRDQRVIAGIGRSWADEILWAARLAPLRRCGDLDADELASLSTAITDTLGDALEHYGEALSLPVPDKLPMPLRIHRRTGDPCPRCATPLLAVHYQDDEMTYCPRCQTGGEPYKDRRLSRLLKD